MSKVKVMHVTGAMNRGGAEIMLMDIFRSISSDFHFDFLINYKKNKGIQKGDFDDEINARGGRLSHIPVQWDIGPFKYIELFEKSYKLFGCPDIVHIHMNIKSGIIALAAKRAGAKVVIIHSHANLTFNDGTFRAFISNIELYLQKILIARYANNFWGCSSEANSSLFPKLKVTESNCKIINNAINIEEYLTISKSDVNALKKKFKKTDQTIVIGNVGRIVRQKNVLFIIEILNEFKKLNLDFVFVYAGRVVEEDYYKEILNKIADYGIENNVIYLGLRDDIPMLMSTFDVFLGPALKEGFGMVAVEAQAAGVPCVLYKGFPESVDMKINLVSILDNFNVVNWVEAIHKLIKVKVTEGQIKSAFQKKGFDSAINTKIIEKLYLEVLAKSN